MDPFLFEVLRDDEHLSLKAGDLLAVDLRRARMWTHSKILQPNYGYLAGLVAEGRLRWLTPQHSVLSEISHPPFPVRVVA